MNRRVFDKIKSEPNITLLLDTAVCAAEVKSDQIQRVVARSDKTESLFRIKATLYAGCTGQRLQSPVLRLSEQFSDDFPATVQSAEMR